MGWARSSAGSHRSKGRDVGSEVFINYWIGQEPNPPSPTLDQMPAYVDITATGFPEYRQQLRTRFWFSNAALSCRSDPGLDQDHSGKRHEGFIFHKRPEARINPCG